MSENTVHLAITLVCGLAGSGKTTVASVVSGGRNAGTVWSDRASDRWQSLAGDAGDASEGIDHALSVAENLCSLADAGHRGHVVVELNPLIDALETAVVLEAMIAARDAQDAQVVLREVIAVASARDVRRLVFGDTDYSGRDDGPSGSVDYDSGEVLCRQIEMAGRVVLTRGDGMDPAAHAEVTALVQKLNPTAVILHAAGRMTAEKMSTYRPGSRAPIGQGLGWMRELAGTAGPPTTVSGISTLVFTDPRPFHPGRLAHVVSSCLEPDTVGQILRSRGLVRLASRPSVVGSWSSSGAILALDPTAMSSWDPESPLGQEIVFFGRDLKPAALRAVLGAALVSGEELIAGPMEWATYPDTFPLWEIDHHH